MDCVNALKSLNICKILSSFLFQIAAALRVFFFFSLLFFFLWLFYLIIPVPPTVRETGAGKQYNFCSKILFTSITVDYSWAFLLDCMLKKFKYGAVVCGLLGLKVEQLLHYILLLFYWKIWNQTCLDFSVLLNCSVYWGGMGQGLLNKRVCVCASVRVCECVRVCVRAPVCMCSRKAILLL